MTETFEILDGVRRAKAAEIVGDKTVPAVVDDGSGVLGPAMDLEVRRLLSPKDSIDVSTAAKFGRFKAILDKTRRGSPPPPIIVVRGGHGKPIADVGFTF